MDDAGAHEVHIRAIRNDDADAYVALLDQVDAESSFLLWEPGERTITPDAVRSAVGQADPNGKCHLVAEVGGRLVGFLIAHRGVTRRIRHRADFAMAVLDEHRGSGIGASLLRALDGWAADQGLTRLEMTVMAHNRRAIDLYERSGFVVEGVKRGAILVDGKPVDECMMAKPVPTPP